MFANSVFLLRTTEVSTVFISFYVAISYDTLAIVQQVYTTLIRVFLLRTTELLSNTWPFFYCCAPPLAPALFILGNVWDGTAILSTDVLLFVSDSDLSAAAFVFACTLNPPHDEYCHNLPPFLWPILCRTSPFSAIFLWEEAHEHPSSIPRMVKRRTSFSTTLPSNALTAPPLPSKPVTIHLLGQ